MTSERRPASPCQHCGCKAASCSWRIRILHQFSFRPLPALLALLRVSLISSLQLAPAPGPAPFSRPRLTHKSL